jgi:hypothetical protein
MMCGALTLFTYRNVVRATVAAALEFIALFFRKLLGSLHGGYCQSPGVLIQNGMDALQGHHFRFTD